MGGKEPRKPQLCRMAEGNFSELFGRTQARKGNFGFLASERQKEKISELLSLVKPGGGGRKF